ncbi:MAG: hypothetical protein FD175_638 [Beijerinckiaceae bacterium]|nr:MAG: hypothetical protein FD175_638 [Beijerinckiaceae bacterium]
MKTGLILACGVYDIAFGVFHLLFWRLFGWPERLQGSGSLNTAITQTLNVMLTYVFSAFGLALATYRTGTPDFVLLVGGGFWALRAALQPLLFDLHHRASRAIALVFVLGALMHLIVPAIDG